MAAADGDPLPAEVWLVRVYFAAVTSCTLLVSLFPRLLAPVVLAYGKLDGLAGQSRFAPPGTVSAAAARALALLAPLTVPKRWFAHFYLLAVAWCALLALRRAPQLVADADAGVAFGIIFSHVCVRLAEEVAAAARGPRSDARLHVAHYALGLTYYVFAPLAVLVETGARGQQATAWFALHHAAAVLLYVFAGVHQWRCHRILRRLRRAPHVHAPAPELSDSSPRASSSPSPYGIPRGDWFDRLSGPHYLAEVLVYAAVSACFCFSNVTADMLLLWVSATLVTIALENHRWYRRTFGERYPPDRKAIIPYLL